MSTIPETLHAFGPTTLVVRALAALSATHPSLAGPTPYATVDDVVAALIPAPTEPVRVAARAAAVDPRSESILALGAAVDGADRALARRLSTDSGSAVDAQSDDAALKVLAIAALGHKLGGEVRFLALPSAAVLVATWAALDVVLPLGGLDLKRLLAGRQAAATSALAALAGEGALDGTPAVLAALLPRLQAEIDQAATRSDAIVRALAPYVPGLVAPEGEGGLPAGVGATIALQGDRLPIYKWLAARLAAESAVLRAAGR